VNYLNSKFNFQEISNKTTALSEIYFGKIDVEKRIFEQKKKKKQLEVKDGSSGFTAFIWNRRRGGKTSLKIPELELGKQ